MADSISMVEDGGDCRVVLIPTSGTTVTFNFSNGSALTSADDTSTQKYFNTNKVRTRFTMVANTDMEFVGMNGTTFTDPFPIDANVAHTEVNTRVATVTIKTSAANCTTRIRGV